MFKRHVLQQMRWLAAPVLALVLLAGPTRAQTAVKPERQATSNQQLAKALHILQWVKKTLEGADHDYGGHRADAVKAVGAAHHQLKLALEFVHKGTAAGAGKPATGTGKPAAGTESQAVSNMELKDAIPVLKATITLLQKADHDYGGHRADAVRDLEAAVKELDKALEFVKKK
jgi:hypothetical protein